MPPSQSREAVDQPRVEFGLDNPEVNSLHEILGPIAITGVSVELVRELHGLVTDATPLSDKEVLAALDESDFALAA